MCGQTEIAQTTPEVTAEVILEETAKWFETHKWTKGKFSSGNVVYDDTTGFAVDADACCAIGAMRIVATKLCKQPVYVPCDKSPLFGQGCPLAARVAVNKLAEVVGKSHVPTWNDDEATSVDDVITALRKAAGTYVAPVAIPEPETTPVVVAPETTTHSPRILKRRDLKPGNVFLYLSWPSSFDTGHDINEVRYVRGKKPGYLFRDTDSHKARFANALASFPNATDAIMDSPCLLLAE